MIQDAAWQALPDYSSLLQLREALWGENEIRGAAVMIGAGFSRCADRVSEASPVPPLWYDFEAAMLARLYPGAKGSYDPLKLAEEYRESLGAHALDSLIRQMVTDEQWVPSELHSRLLGLPWVDVLTTNWDTLLERTSLPNPDRYYDVVRTVHDIARTRSPRIVKLHGSLPSQQPFIFTAEDFRTYPRNFPAFINLAQQVLLENDLCLVGFSGDDPNFLQWAGWVRDQLGSSARRIRLVGALNLSNSQRQVLEQRNVTPIDLGPLVRGLERGEAHREAAKIFLDVLWTAKPKPRHIWNRPHRHRQPTAEGDPETIVREYVSGWEADRKSYPGWLVAPPVDRERLLYEPDNWIFVIGRTLPRVSVGLRAQAVAELAWKYETALSPLHEFVRTFFAEALGGGESEHLSKADRIRIATALVIDARHNRVWGRFFEWLTYLEGIGGDEVEAVCSYQRALKAKGDFDFPKMAELAPRVKGNDPVWAMRRAFLYCSLCEYNRAAEIIREAKADIHARRLRENKSIWLLSREAWASWLFRSASWELDHQQAQLDDDFWPSTYSAAATDPWDHMQALDNQISKELEDRTSESIAFEPRFDAGAYRDNTRSTAFASTRLRAFTAGHAVRLAEHVGLPDRIGRSSILGDRIARAVKVMPNAPEPYVFWAAVHLRDANEGLIDQIFGRVNIARLDVGVAAELAANLKPAIEYALARVSRSSDAWLEHGRLFLEILSRLMIVQTPEDAKRTFIWAMELSAGQGLANFRLAEPLGHLLQRSLEAVPPASRSELANYSLRLQLPSERKLFGIHRYWPELSDVFSSSDFEKLGDIPNWGFRVDEIIEIVRIGDNLNRTRALLRVMLLAESRVLTESQRSNLAVAVWSRRDADDGMPADLDVLPHTFLILPEPTPETAEKAFHKHVVQPLIRGEFSYDLLTSLQGACRTKSPNPFKLTEQDALALLEKYLAWRPAAADTHDYFGQVEEKESAVGLVVGVCLAWAVLPVITPEMIGTELTELWVDAISNSGVASFLMTAPHLAALVSSRSEWVTKCIRKALVAREEDTVRSALSAMYRFTYLNTEIGMSVPASICADIAGMCAVRREPGLLQSLTVARHLTIGGHFTDDDQQRVIDALDVMFVDFDYKRWDTNDPRTKALSLLRAECVRLALALSNAGRSDVAVQQWISARERDAFPEVRFAIVGDVD